MQMIQVTTVLYPNTEAQPALLNPRYIIGCTRMEPEDKDGHRTAIQLFTGTTAYTLRVRDSWADIRKQFNTAMEAV